MEEEKDRKTTANKTESKPLSSLFSREFLDSCIFRFAFYSVYATFGSTLTYLPLYFKQLGLDAAQVGVLTGLRPFIQAVGAPLAGLIADKYKKRKLVVIIALFAFMGKHLGILLVKYPHKTCLKTSNFTTQIPNITTNIHDKREMLTAALYAKPQTWNTAATDSRHLGNRDQDEQPAIKSAGEIRDFVSPEDGVKNSHDLEKRKRRQMRSDNSIHYTIVTNRSDVDRVFREVLLIIIIGELIASSLMSLLDGAVVEYLGDDRNNYGQYRLWGSIGIGSSVLLIGAVIQKYVYYFCETLQNHYSILFYFLFGFGCLTLIPLLFSKQIYSDAQDKHQSGISKMKGLFCSIKSISFWMAIISLALLDGFQMDFGPWFLDDLGTSSLMIGIATATHFAVNACTFVMSPYIINKLGYMPVLSIGLFVHAVMFIMFSFTKASWVGMTLFALVGFVSSLSWSCGITYVAMVSTPLGIVSTGEGLLNGIYTGIGISIGTITGGAIIKTIGIRIAFRTLAGFSLFMLVVFNILLFIDKKLTTQTDSSYKPLSTSEGSNDGNDE